MKLDMKVTTCRTMTLKMKVMVSSLGKDENQMLPTTLILDTKKYVSFKMAVCNKFVYHNQKYGQELCDVVLFYVMNEVKGHKWVLSPIGHSLLLPWIQPFWSVLLTSKLF